MVSSSTDMLDLALIGATYAVHLMTETDLDNYRATMSDVIRAAAVRIQSARSMWQPISSSPMSWFSAWLPSPR